MNLKNMRRRDFTRFAGGLGALAIGGRLLPSGALAQGKDTVSIATVSGIYAQTLTKLMINQGYLEQFGLEAKYVPVADGSKIIGALLSGEVDVCMGSGFPQVLPAIEKGGKLKILATASNAVMSVIYSGNPEIKSIKDLEGRTIGIGSLGAMVHTYVVAMLRKEGIDEKNVKFVNIGGNADIFRAVSAGIVDAGPGEPQFMFEQEKYKVHVVAEVYKALPEFIGQASYASGSVVADRRDVLVRTLAAYRRLYRFVQEGDSQDAWIKARSEAMGKDQSSEGLNQWNLLRQNKLMPIDLVMPEESVRWMQELNASLGVQQKIVPFDTATDMSLARDAIALEDKS
ncbi:ABC transporter substrate-binding protein [Aminobacter sp. AP02]|uniref:ABC transporter substrate-binding protein n=1 Tax=Aminobacter sp. AP02 TaxID=2135737 RepID=UPI000D6BEB30|nr:ABC transporter substrate-binding protein [Aminobacter sp. AP02]PWK61304.1 ABC-type nitrate/sulfonate/bicarbonate transport system substrate-binding protein [Aminobacter sp. AP02]